jgi:hypothetical protein
MTCHVRNQARLSKIVAVGAVLSCFAIVLNVGGPAKLTKPEKAHLAADPFVTSSPAATEQANEFQPGMSLFVTQLFALTEQMRLPAEAPPGVNAMSATDSNTQPQPALVGVWAPDSGTCSSRDFRQGLLPAVINSDGAWAGDTFCKFNNRTETQNGWRVEASCSNGREQWTTLVRLTVAGNRLKWASNRGSQIYTRCPVDFRVARAGT